MRAKKAESGETSGKRKKIAATFNPELTTIITGRTGLTPAKNAVVKILPSDYNQRTVEDALDYLLQHKGLRDEEIAVARSIKTEMNSTDYVVVINGKNANLTDKLANYVSIQKHTLPNSVVKQYNSYEFEVSAVQEGGLQRLY